MLYDSFILRREDLHINHPAYNIYEWEPVNKRKGDRTLENRRIVFEDMEKKNMSYGKLTDMFGKDVRNVGKSV